MTQTATVQRILSNGMAEIAVPRKSACGHDCEECAGCGISGSSVLASAANPIGAVPGEKVIVETSTRQLLGIIALVYSVPLVLFLVGCFLPFTGPICNLLWLFAGDSLRSLFVNHRKPVNVIMALSLIVCAISIVMH